MAEEWNQLFNQYFKSSITPIAIPESLAPFYYFKGTNKIQGGAYKPVVSIDIGGGTTDIVVFKSNKALLLSSFKFAANTIFGDGFSEYGAASSNGLIQKYSPHYEALLVNNGLNRLLEVFRAIKTKNRSEDINAFLFSIENNTSINSSKQYSYNELLAQDEDIKIVFLYFYAAIIYHVAQLMKLKGIELPKHIILSGTGSKVLQIITPDRSLLTKFSKVIFEKVYGQNFDQDGLSIETEKNQPKEVTCKGGLMTGEGDLVEDLEEIKHTLTGLEDIGIATLRYSELDAAIKKSMVSYIENFHHFFLSLNDDLNFVDDFTISPAAFTLFKQEAGKHLPDYLENALGFNAKIDELSDDKELEESLFFYPLIGTINNLISQLAGISTVKH